MNKSKSERFITDETTIANDENDQRHSNKLTRNEKRASIDFLSQIF